MRKLILFFGLLTLGTISLTAQNQEPNLEETILMYVDGDMLQVIDRDHLVLEESVILEDCTVLNSDGSFQAMDGGQSRLKDGECMDMYGIKYRNEYQYRYKVKKENKDLTGTQLDSRYEKKYHFIKIGSKVYQITDVSQKRLRKDITIGNGIVLDPYGTYQEPGQERVRLRDGECLNMGGVKFDNSYDQRKLMAKKIKKTNAAVQ
ncbi:DUF6799 domain-containing protein [Aquimarina sp. MMG016]|uniref:DUF6799 domain-containing protein n=1 Tax=Aquimarina sp. MMG016 TaxID=2822690 RepID=UPI001B3A01AA|nr:DUF6799 domain-containing protein [Aquimarina sp. MMG016]MBQ4819650.1 hypothetical protein [Aquimarina sp. MMG016]